jgi:hypothetical protein
MRRRFFDGSERNVKQKFRSNLFKGLRFPKAEPLELLAESGIFANENRLQAQAVFLLFFADGV